MPIARRGSARPARERRRGWSTGTVRTGTTSGAESRGCGMASTAASTCGRRGPRGVAAVRLRRRRVLGGRERGGEAGRGGPAGQPGSDLDRRRHRARARSGRRRRAATSRARRRSAGPRPPGCASISTTAFWKKPATPPSRPSRRRTTTASGPSSSRTCARASVRLRARKVLGWWCSCGHDSDGLDADAGCDLVVGADGQLGQGLLDQAAQVAAHARAADDDGAAATGDGVLGLDARASRRGRARGTAPWRGTRRRPSGRSSPRSPARSRGPGRSPAGAARCRGGA